MDDLLAYTIEVGAQFDQHLRGHTLTLADEAQQDVLRADVVVSELQRLTKGELQDLLGAGGEGNVAAGSLLALPDDLLNLRAHGFERDAQALQSLGCDTLALVDEAEQDVLGADVVVVEHPGLFLGQDNDPSGPVGKPLEHAHHSSLAPWGTLAASPESDACRPGLVRC